MQRLDVAAPPALTLTPARQKASRNELRALLALTLPILGGQVAQTANGFVDTVMAGAVSPLDLAAVAVGASIWVPVFLFMVGVIIAATPILSQHIGAGLHDNVVPTAWQALWLSLGIGVSGFFVVRYAATLFGWLDVPTHLHAMTQQYLHNLSWGLPGIAIFIGLRSYTESLSHTTPVLAISFTGLAANIPLNYVFIHGKFGMPAMGGAGCGAATAMVMWLMALLMWLYVRRSRHYRERTPSGTRITGMPPMPDLGAIGAMLALGLPIGLAIFFEVSIFSVIAILLSTMGEQVIAGHQIALNFASLTFMLPLSLAVALTVRTGYAAGAGNLAAARLAVRTGAMLSVCIALFNAALLGFGRDLIPALYTDDNNVRALAASLLLYAALFQLPDALQVAASGALRGFKDTKSPMWLTLVAYWGIGLPVGWALGFGTPLNSALGPQGFWIGLIVGLTVAAILLNARVFSYLSGRRPLPAG
ncbi:MAG: MATE family efflux transporter [Gammaproteobacteria bacterium]